MIVFASGETNSGDQKHRHSRESGNLIAPKVSRFRGNDGYVRVLQ